MDIIPNNNTQIALLITILVLLIIGVCCLLSLVSGLYYPYFTNTPPEHTIYVPTPVPSICPSPSMPIIPIQPVPISPTPTNPNECPPAIAELNKKCKENMDWLQKNWEPSWATGIMKENTRCLAYNKAKQENICP